MGKLDLNQVVIRSVLHVFSEKQLQIFTKSKEENQWIPRLLLTISWKLASFVQTRDDYVCSSGVMQIRLVRCKISVASPSTVQTWSWNLNLCDKMVKKEQCSNIFSVWLKNSFLPLQRWRNLDQKIKMPIWSSQNARRLYKDKLLRKLLQWMTANLWLIL